ncbi:Ubiquitin carboxyl-terminal hydrolase 25 like protein [Argiope bruennichi]|uniref:Ubiquitin carboxyl-terminal hydrolase 25 like protein n=1 Tax=Argiope bruennichi TaxID=94029 RepID=A0A8T0ELJ1_ARGBR|nr:Ubiquitin carboxyl-terminal hydrolase 25 like protein [Argiope bruennichi]
MTVEQSPLERFSNQKQQQQPPLLNVEKDGALSPTAGVIDLTNDGADKEDDLKKAIALSLKEHEKVLGGQVSMEDQDISRVVEASLAESKAVGTKRKRGEVWQDPLNPHDRKRNGDWPVGLKNVGNTCWFSAVIQDVKNGIGGDSPNSPNKVTSMEVVNSSNASSEPVVSSAPGLISNQQMNHISEDIVPSPQHISDMELKVFQACLKRWRKEIESNVKILYDSTNTSRFENTQFEHTIPHADKRMEHQASLKRVNFTESDCQSASLFSHLDGDVSHFENISPHKQNTGHFFNALSMEHAALVHRQTLGRVEAFHPKPSQTAHQAFDELLRQETTNLRRLSRMPLADDLRLQHIGIYIVLNSTAPDVYLTWSVLEQFLVPELDEFPKRISCLKLNESVANQFEKSSDLKKALDALCLAYEYILPSMEFLAAQDASECDIEVAEKIRNRWCSMLGIDLASTKQEKLQDFLSKLLDPSNDLPKSRPAPAKKRIYNLEKAYREALDMAIKSGEYEAAQVAK